MNSDRMIIIGANGQLGRALVKKYPEAVAVDSTELDITNRDNVANFDWSNTEVIVNAAAYTNVDGAESPEGRAAAWNVNATAAAYLAEVAIKHDVTLIHISSDYVFDGTQENHTEDEAYSPLSVYGASKAAGDIAVSLVPKHYIVRTSWVIGDGNNFVRTMLGLAKKSISPTVVSDQVGRLSFTSELVRAIDHLMTVGAPFGTYNVTNSGKSASWAEVTREIFSLAGRDDLTVTDTTTAEYFADKDGIAPRPLQSTLDLNKIQSSNFKSIDWKQDLKAYIEKELQ